MRARTTDLLMTLLLAACIDPAPPRPGARHEALEAADEVRVVEEIHGRGEDRSAGSPDDIDQDGIPAEADLDDFDELVGRARPEILCDGRDQDGDLADRCEVDVDGDGAAGELDCDDLDPEVGPDAPEVRCNGRDENCNGVDDCDRDGDGLRDVDDPAPDDPTIVLPADVPVPRWP